MKIPAGIATGQQLRLYGEGEHGSAGGPPGDLYVVVHVQEHAFFHREGDDLLLRAADHFPTLALGGSDQGADARRPRGPEHSRRHAARRAVPLRGKGMPNVGGRGHGDLHVIARAAVPKKLTKEQKQILEQLGKTLPEQAKIERSQRDKPFFERVKDIFGCGPVARPRPALIIYYRSGRGRFSPRSPGRAARRLRVSLAIQEDDLADRDVDGPLRQRARTRARCRSRDAQRRHARLDSRPRSKTRTGRGGHRPTFPPSGSAGDHRPPWDRRKRW